MSVDDLVLMAAVLGVCPADLMTPQDSRERIDVAGVSLTPELFQGWLRKAGPPLLDIGDDVHGTGDWSFFLSQGPDWEFIHQVIAARHNAAGAAESRPWNEALGYEWTVARARRVRAMLGELSPESVEALFGGDGLPFTLQDLDELIERLEGNPTDAATNPRIGTGMSVLSRSQGFVGVSLNPLHAELVAARERWQDQGSSGFGVVIGHDITSEHDEHPRRRWTAFDGSSAWAGVAELPAGRDLDLAAVGRAVESHLLELQGSNHLPQRTAETPGSAPADREYGPSIVVDLSSADL